MVVADLDLVEAQVRKAGFTPQSYADYAPERRFYFKDHDEIEYEVVQYRKKSTARDMPDLALV